MNSWLQVIFSKSTFLVLAIVGIAFVALRLLGVIAWPWPLVLAPLGLVLILLVALIALSLFLAWAFGQG